MVQSRHVAQQRASDTRPCNLRPPMRHVGKRESAMDGHGLCTWPPQALMEVGGRGGTLPIWRQSPPLPPMTTAGQPEGAHGLHAGGRAALKSNHLILGPHTTFHSATCLTTSFPSLPAAPPPAATHAHQQPADMHGAWLCRSPLQLQAGPCLMAAGGIWPNPTPMQLQHACTAVKREPSSR